MNYINLLNYIKVLCNDHKLNFSEKSIRLEKEILSSNINEILDLLDFIGIIPESFDHDSTEEKLFSKFTDSLLAKILSELEIESKTLDTRADSADVFGKTQEYTLVGDAKAFRMSRTAKNQKDFKVAALNQWRKQEDYEAEYALLIAPLYQYPSTKSQIYEQAIRLNVTLLSYTHLKFLLKNKTSLANKSLKPLLEVGKSLQIIPKNEKKLAKSYWKKINEILIDLTNTKITDLNEIKIELAKILTNNLNKELRIWEQEKIKISNMTKEILVDTLIKALKINKKIEVIRKTSDANIEQYFVI